MKYKRNEETRMYKILVCDDEKDIVTALGIYLGAEGYTVINAYNGKEALAIISKEDVHLVLLDIMMPEMDGISTMVEIRKLTNIPIILLTAKSEDSDKVLGLNIGADDYITKPFNPIEVLARVKSQLRRYMNLGGGTIRPNAVVNGGLMLDEPSQKVTLDGEEVSLTPTEYDILRLFMLNPGKVFSPKEIYKRVWNDSPVGVEGTVAVHIRHIREKIEINAAEPRYIKVVWGKGYKLEVNTP